MTQLGGLLPNPPPLKPSVPHPEIGSQASSSLLYSCSSRIILACYVQQCKMLTFQKYLSEKRSINESTQHNCLEAAIQAQMRFGCWNRSETYLLTMTQWCCFDMTGTSPSKMLRTNISSTNEAESFHNFPTGKSHTWTWAYFDFDVMWFLTVINVLLVCSNKGNSPAVFLTHFCLVAQ